MVLKLDSRHLQTIAAHAESTYPEECCGLLLGTVDATGTTIVAIKSTENAWSADAIHISESLNKTRRYEIAPEVMLATMRESRDRDLAIVGIYHSHPDQPAVPSECDRQLAWQHYSYVIVSVEQGSAIDGRSWRLDANHQFQPEEILMPDGTGERMSKGNG
ncbi:MAG: M67 family metallopeptidase [Phormidesmis sp. CAN_BIN36]|nr:M67 family metallopeptidase [Phormidesmis sp. CAN_BIN36]